MADKTIKCNALTASRLSVAPMMDWTDRHCRMLHRQLSGQALLYTEMVTAAAVVRGDAVRFLRFDPAEHPVAVQLGGSDPGELAEATAIAAEMGYDEVNLNVGCPSDRVQSGRFGAVLMQEPDLVARCLRAMIAAAGPTPVTVKCRIGVDNQNPAETLPAFVATQAAAGVRRFIIHARKAWLQGLSPKENREVPPLDYPLVAQAKATFPELFIAINGGIETLEEACAFLDQGIDGVMIGRAAYHRPADILGAADRVIFGAGGDVSAEAAVAAMRPYIAAELAAGTGLHQITRHMLGLFTGRPGARAWRRILSERARLPGAGLATLDEALAQVTAQAA
ncbi:MAG: tRNA dihydrouridine(20/20a) synthase DusA [Pseudomonadota bacterium]